MCTPMNTQRAMVQIELPDEDRAYTAAGAIGLTGTFGTLVTETIGVKFSRFWQIYARLAFYPAAA